MQTIKLLSAAIAAAAISLTPVAIAHEHGDHGAHHTNPASDARGTEGNPGVGGSVAVPTAGDGAKHTSPYEDDPEDERDDDRSTMQDITSGDRPITDESGRRSD
jgi:hypothetical protein